MDARPDLKLAVTRGTAPNTYTIKAVVSDLRSGSVLATPVMIAHARAAARAEVGGVEVKGMVSVAFSVTVDPSGKTDEYSSEVKDNAGIVASQSATLAVAQ